MTRHVLFGWQDLGLEDARRAVERGASVSLAKRESDYLGGDYFGLHSDSGTEVLRIQMNFVDEDGVPFEPDFPLHRVLAYLANASAELEDAIRGVQGVEVLLVEDVQP